MKSFQKNRVIILFALAFVYYHVASATPIIGKVTDAGTGEAIIGATIYDSRTHQGVITDAVGCFFLTLSLMSGIGAPVAILGIILPIYTIIDMVEAMTNRDLARH